MHLCLVGIVSFGRLQAETVSKACEIVEDADDMRDFEAGAIIEAQCPQRLPVLWRHAGWGCAELFGDGAQRAFACRQPFDLTPTASFDRGR